MSDLISRQAAIDAMRELPYGYRGIVWNILNSLPSTKQPRTCEFWDDESNFCTLHRPSAEPKPLTDKEQRIFLAAMEREKQICEEVDRNYVREPYEDSLARICHEITRKVKGALWT